MYGRRPVPNITDESSWLAHQYTPARALQDARSEPQRRYGEWPGGEIRKTTSSFRRCWSKDQRKCSSCIPRTSTRTEPVELGHFRCVLRRQIARLRIVSVLCKYTPFGYCSTFIDRFFSFWEAGMRLMQRRHRASIIKRYRAPCEAATSKSGTSPNYLAGDTASAGSPGPTAKPSS
jgi:hypothetical protein